MCLGNVRIWQIGRTGKEGCTPTLPGSIMQDAVLANSQPLCSPCRCQSSSPQYNSSAVCDHCNHNSACIEGLPMPTPPRSIPAAGSKQALTGRGLPQAAAARVPAAASHAPPCLLPDRESPWESPWVCWPLPSHPQREKSQALELGANCPVLPLQGSAYFFKGHRGTGLSALRPAFPSSRTFEEFK